MTLRDNALYNLSLMTSLDDVEDSKRRHALSNTVRALTKQGQIISTNWDTMEPILDESSGTYQS